MVDSSRTIMTDAGFALETRVRADETKMQFTRAAISTDDHFSDTDDALAKLTELSNIQQDGKVTAVQVINTTTVYVQVDVNQAESKADYQMRSAALYAKDDDGTEVLYGVTVLQDPVFVHKDADGSYLGFGINTTVGRASNVVVVVDPANMVTQQVFESTMKNYYTKAEVDAKFVTDDDFASKLPKNIATTDAANTFAKSQTLAGGATDGAGNAIATTKDVSDGDATTLKSAKEYADTKVSGKADDSTVVHTADMRKAPSDVAGVEEVSTLQTQVDNSAVGTNLLINTSSSSTNRKTAMLGANNSLYGVYSRTDSYEQITSPNPYEYYQFVTPDTNNLYGLTPGETYTLSGSASVTVGILKFKSEYSIKGSSWSGTDLSDLGIPVSDGSVFAPFSHTFTIPVGATGVYISLQNYNYTGSSLFRFKNMKLEKGSVATDWCPNPSEILTESDDSKVAHLSGANNFDTVPTVNNNPLLLASSLPSDLARLSQDANFTAKLQQNGQDVALANNTIARNPNTGVVSEPVDFTKLTVNGGKSVATSDDLKSLETSAWRVLDNKCITAFTKYNTSIKVDENSLFLVKIDEVNKRVYMFFTILGNFVENSSIYIDLTSIVKNLSFPSYHLYYLEGNTASSTADGSIVGNRICFKIQIYDTTVLNSKYSSYMVNANDAGWIYSSCFVNYDELV